MCSCCKGHNQVHYQVNHCFLSLYCCKVRKFLPKERSYSIVSSQLLKLKLKLQLEVLEIIYCSVYILYRL